MWIFPRRAWKHWAADSKIRLFSVIQQLLQQILSTSQRRTKLVLTKDIRQPPSRCLIFEISKGNEATRKGPFVILPILHIIKCLVKIKSQKQKQALSSIPNSKITAEGIGWDSDPFNKVFWRIERNKRNWHNFRLTITTSSKILMMKIWKESE